MQHVSDISALRDWRASWAWYKGAAWWPETNIFIGLILDHNLSIHFQYSMQWRNSKSVSYSTRRYNVSLCHVWSQNIFQSNIWVKNYIKPRFIMRNIISYIRPAHAWGSHKVHTVTQAPNMAVFDEASYGEQNKNAISPSEIFIRFSINS